MTKKPLTLLLIEDDPINILLAKRVLSQHNFDIWVAENGKKGVDMYTASPSQIDVILMDIQMPIMNGVEATEKIREYEKDTTMHIPIIALTGYPEYREQALKHGMDDFLEKPFSIDALLASIHQFVEF